METKRKIATTLLTGITGTQQIVTGEGILDGIFVSSTSSGTIRFIDGTTAGGSLFIDTFTPAAGYHNMGSARFYNGLYAGTAGTTINFTVFIREV